MTSKLLNNCNPGRADNLAIDTDLEMKQPATRSPRPIHLHWKYIGLVFVGGAIGTCIRYLLSAAFPVWQGLSVVTFAINISGAFLLGWLLETLSRSGPDQRMRRAIRLFVGTGILGGYTTYSSFAVDTDGLIASDQFAISALYGLATVLIGAAVSLAGIMTGAAIHRVRVRWATR